MTIEEIRQFALQVAAHTCGYETPESVTYRANVYANFVAMGIAPSVQPQGQPPLPYAYGAIGQSGVAGPATPDAAQGQAIWDAVKNSARR